MELKTTLVIVGIFATASFTSAAHTDRPNWPDDLRGSTASVRATQVKPTPSADTTALTSRVEAYWKRREAKDLTGAYPFYCSAYKNRVPLAEFLKLTRLTRFDVHDMHVVRTIEAAAGMQVTLAYEVILPTVSLTPVTGETTESWTHDVDGQWCKEDEPLILPFPKLGSRQ